MSLFFYLNRLSSGSQNAAPVYLYNFGYKSGLKVPNTDFPMGTAHAMDIVKRPTYRIDAECEVISDRNKSERELWASLGYLGNQD